MNNSVVDSPLFGKSYVPINEDQKTIDRFVKDSPVAVFGSLNKALNERGFCISIDIMRKKQVKTWLKKKKLSLGLFLLRKYQLFDK